MSLTQKSTYSQSRTDVAVTDVDRPFARVSLSRILKLPSILTLFNFSVIPRKRKISSHHTSYNPRSKLSKLICEASHFLLIQMLCNLSNQPIDDSAALKVILTRLTQHSTFPNVLLHGKSLGGWDELRALHSSNSLTTVLAERRIVVQNGNIYWPSNLHIFVWYFSYIMNISAVTEYRIILDY